MTENTSPLIVSTSRGDRIYTIGFRGELDAAGKDIVTAKENWWVIEEGRNAGKKTPPTNTALSADGQLVLTFADSLGNRRLYHSKAITG